MKCTQRICGWIAFAVAASPLAAHAQQNPQRTPQSGQPAQVQAPQAQVQIIATVDGDPITQQEVIASVQAQLQGQQIDPAQVDPATVQQIQEQVVDSLIDSRLVEQYMLDQGPDVPEQEVQRAIDQLKAQLQTQQVSFEEFLASRGYTEEMLRTRVESSLAWQKFQQQETREQNLQQFYQANSQHFQAENFEQARPQVASALIGKLWEDIVRRTKPQAEIRLAGAGEQAAPRPAGQPEQR